MQRIQKIVLYYVSLTILYRLTYLFDLDEPWSTLRPYTPYLFILAFGAHLGVTLLYNVATTHDKPQAYVDLVNDIKEAQDALKAKGLVIEE
ncbi:dolichol-phosphate mannosyltransferase subunit 3 [Schizosaccharomyces cryophilus OY26]|uniref:Dolichol-phosphate mannosyltransferase subunit 3 n=1 Tax=Schizosaccharomyces cryophilus (strain OY26 / ATCC MYA-4695 / CBS 11777 / NBRC 106824 / NRRL Y48691) TaxID=653667 RepID=S9XIY8_SCHCR|nr:dolichol-phosphate mannosyltransferase subunit 3 [Schizosaccharomyces cryophilus OY26]EPY53596.1 dolichol-phosphate mannosyltransferase subunit 3 [Schizosaccharomyces cryophilus OY26]